MGSELLEIELFDYLTVCKQITLIELLFVYSSNWNHWTVCKQVMNSKLKYSY